MWAEHFIEFFNILAKSVDSKFEDLMQLRESSFACGYVALKKNTVYLLCIKIAACFQWQAITQIFKLNDIARLDF